MSDRFKLGVVSRELLEKFAAEHAPPTPPTTAKPSFAVPPRPESGSGEYRSRLLVDRWLADRGVGFRVKAEPDGRGRTVYVLKECPFDPSHGDPDACVMQAADGRLSAQCFHNSCKGRGWQAFKEQIGPPEAHDYDPPLSGHPRPPQGQVKAPVGQAPARAAASLRASETARGWRVTTTGRNTSWKRSACRQTAKRR